MQVTICGSMKFIGQMGLLKESLENLGHQVFMPVQNLAPDAYQDLSASGKKQYKQDCINDHIHKIKLSDAILVVNYNKDGISNYIGSNTFLEMGFAYLMQKRIFLLNPIPQQSNYEEIIALEPRVILGNLDLIKDAQVITKKVWPNYFQQIVDGNKKYELRLGDWSCQEGDILVLQEWDPNTQSYTGRELKKEIKHVLRTKDVSFWAKEEIDTHGFQIISFE